MAASAAPGASGQTTSTTGSSTITSSTSSTTQITRPTTTTVPDTTSSTAATTTSTGPTTTTNATSVTTLATTTTTTRPLGAATTAAGPDPTAGPTTLPVGAATTTTTLPLLGPDTKADDLEAWELEVTEGTQNLANDMPLVTGRTTMVRAYVRSDKKNITGVRGILGGWRGKNYLGSVVSSNQPIVASTGGGVRTNTDDSLYFHLPNSWTADGVTRFTVFVYQATVDFTFDKESDTDNNFMTEYVEFNAMAPLKLYMPPLHLHNGGADNTFNLFDNLGPIVRIITGLKRLLPVSDFQVVVPQTPLFPPSHGTFEWDLNESSVDKNGNRLVPLTTVAAAKAASNLYDDWSWYAMIDPSQPYTSWDENTGAPFNVGGSASGGVAQGKMDDSVEAAVPWDMTGAGTLAHELGHNGGLSHYLCKGDEAKGGGIDPDFPTPFENCTMSIPTNSGFWGLDVFYTTFDYIPKPIAVSPKPDAVKPNKSSPLMGYAADKWLDPYSYCKLLQAYGVGCGAYPPDKDEGLPVQQGAPKAGPQLISSVSQADPAQFVTVSGIVRTAQGTASLVDVTSSTEATPEAWAAATARYEAVTKAKASGFTLQLEGPAGEKVDRVLADPDPPAHEELTPSAFAFANLVEAPFTPVAVRVLKGTVVVAERKASATDPTITVVAPNGGEKLAGAVDVRWQAGDRDNDRLVFDIAYSPDGGTRWRSITTGATGTSLRIPASDLEASKTGVFRVTARDGFRTASDVSDAAFEAPDSPPSLALVLSPNDGRTFRLGDLVVLQGTASDLTDGLVADLSWTSDRDGDLGSGAEVATRNLSAGAHRITLTATDKAGGTAEMSINLTIDPTQLADVPDDAELAKLEARLQAAPAEETAARSPDDDDDTAGSTVVAIIGIGLALAVLAAAVVVLRKRRRSTPDAP